MSETLDLPGTALVVIPGNLLPTVIAADTDDLLGKLKAKIAAFEPDASTHEGREEIRKMAAEVRRTKAALERIADGLTEGWRKSHLAVVAEKKVIKERLDGLYENVREQLTAHENRQKQREQGHKDALSRLIVDPALQHATAAQIAAEIAAWENLPSRDWEEFQTRAQDAMRTMGLTLMGWHDAAVKREAEAAELARLRAEEAERQRKADAEAQRQREADLARKAAEAATAAAEQKAAAEKAAMERKAQAERDAAAKREREAAEALEKYKLVTKREAERAEAQRKADAAAAEQRQAEAVAAERRRQEEAAAAEKAEADRRAADKAHKARINREALQDLCGAANLTTEQAQAVVVAVASRKVRHMAVSY